MKIQSKEVSVARAQLVAVRLGRRLGLLDNQRNIRAATMAEVEEFCFGPLRQIDLEEQRAEAIAAANIAVTAFDDPA